MCEILVKAVDASLPDPEKDRSGCYKRGYPVIAFEDGHEWGREEGLPRFIVIKLPGASLSAAQAYIQEWRRSLAFNILASTPATDTHTVQISATAVNPNSGEGKVSRKHVEAFLAGWGAEILSIADNDVTFRIKILDAIKSRPFWGGLRVDDLFFLETNYSAASGVHRIEINYSLKTIRNEQEREAFVTMARRNAVFVSLDPTNKILTLDIARTTVRDEFFNDVKARAGQTIVRRRLKLRDAFVAEAGAYQLTGLDSALLRAARIAAEAGAYVLAGQDVTLIYVPGGGAYVLTAEGGAYAITGMDAGVLKTSRLAAEPGAYVLTGIDAAALLGRLLDAGSGAYAISGGAAELLRAARIAAEAGAYAVTGQDANLSASVAVLVALLEMLRPSQRIVLSPQVTRIVTLKPAERIVQTTRSEL